MKERTRERKHECKRASTTAVVVVAAVFVQFFVSQPLRERTERRESNSERASVVGGL